MHTHPLLWTAIVILLAIAASFVFPIINTRLDRDPDVAKTARYALAALLFVLAVLTSEELVPVEAARFIAVYWAARRMASLGKVDALVDKLASIDVRGRLANLLHRGA
jgi:hypothetical protein